MTTTSRFGLSSAGVLRSRPGAALALAVGATLAALLARLSLDGIFPPGFPFLTFFPAIIVTAYYAGPRAGVLCALLSTAAAWYFLIPPFGSFTVDRVALVPLATFTIVSTVDVILIDIMQRALDRLEAERQVTKRLYDQQRTLFQELQHRVANNMAFISGLLRLQSRRIAADPDTAPAVFEDAVARIETMGRIHRRLYDPEAARQSLAVHLQAVCDELVAATGAAHVTCHVDLPATVAATVIEIDRLLPLSMLVAEIVTNSLKHGFPGGGAGRIDITMESGGDGRVLVIRDNGVGLPPGHDPDAGSGLGLRIVKGLARQAGGSIETSSDGGVVTRVALPA